MGGDLQVHSSPGEGATFWFTAPFGFEQAAATAPAPEARRMRILIAEDNPVNQLVLAAQLHVLGHASFTVINGHEALAALDRGSWDAAFLDCQMPLLDGYQTIAAIRKREAGTPRHLWVTAISANALEGQREICLRAGMDDFIPKPFDTQQLAQAIARIPCPSLDARPPVDAGRLQELASSKSTSGANLLEKMTTLFLGSGAEILDQMDAAIETGDFPTTARAAHKLGGGCSYFGARELHALCIETEQLARSSDPAVLRNIAPRIRQEYLRVAQALRQNSPGQPVSA
jgi:CheY-like chemotaxis protein